MPVRFSGKKDLIGIFILVASPAIIGMIASILIPLMHEHKILLITVFILIIFLAVILYKHRRKKQA